MIGAMFPIIHLGRPWLFFWLVPVSQRTADLAELPLAARLGLLRHQHVSHRQHAVPAAADDSRFRADPRSVVGMAPANLRLARARLAGDAQAVAPAGIGDADHGHRHPAGGRLGAHDRLVRLLDGGRADVAFDNLRSLLRRRRNLQRHRRAHRRDGVSASGFFTSRSTCTRCTSRTSASSC